MPDDDTTPTPAPDPTPVAPAPAALALPQNGSLLPLGTSPSLEPPHPPSA